MERVRAAAGRVRREGAAEPDWAFLLESGFDGLEDAVDAEASIPYASIPGFAPAEGAERGGRLLLGTLEGRAVAVMCGRHHRHEGHSRRDLGRPVRVLRELGAGTIVTAGPARSAHPLWERGDVALVSDHVNLTGDNPLVGPNVEAQGPRFPDMSDAYDEALRRRARDAALEIGLPLREGVFAAVAGPGAETPAEGRMLRRAGADLVGSSAVPEVIVARHAGMRVLGTAVITRRGAPADLRAGDGRAADAAARLSRLLRAVAGRA